MIILLWLKVDSMIYTITLNPCIDYFITVDGEMMDTEVNRASSEVLKAAGKGINVSKILNELGINSISIALLGGFTGKYIEDKISEYKYIKMIPVAVEGNNRINVKIHNDDKTLCVNGNGPVASKSTIEHLKHLLGDTSVNDYVLICGSMMKGICVNDIENLVKLCQINHAKVVLDMEILTLDDYAKLKPYLIKPNLYELSKIFNEDISIDNVDNYLDLLINLGIENILLSLGKDGAIFYSKNTKLRLTHPLVNAINKVGSGDAMLAAFIGKISENSNVNEALKWAGSAGLTTVTTLEDISKEDIISNLKLMKVD